jgi:hypothetical protein
MRSQLLIVLVLAGATMGCRRTQQVTPVRSPGRVYSSPAMGAQLWREARLGEVLKSRFVPHQKEGETPPWWSIETPNGVGVGSGSEFAAVPIPSTVMYVQAATDVLESPGARKKVVQQLPAHQKVGVAQVAVSDAAWVLLVKDGVGLGFVEKASLDTVP